MNLYVVHSLAAVCLLSLLSCFCLWHFAVWEKAAVWQQGVEVQRWVDEILIIVMALVTGISRSLVLTVPQWPLDQARLTMNTISPRQTSRTEVLYCRNVLTVIWQQCLLKCSRQNVPRSLSCLHWCHISWPVESRSCEMHIHTHSLILLFSLI